MATDYDIGNAVAHLSLVKWAGTPENSYSMHGKIYLSSSGWLLLSVPAALVRGAFDALNEPGIELYKYEGSFNPHITIMTSDEVTSIGADNITDRGHTANYRISGLKHVKPSGKDISRVWFLEVKSPDLEKIRKSYGLTPLPKGDHQFHITIGARKTGVLQHNEVSKAAAVFHIAGPSGAGKSTALDKIKTMIPHAAVKDLDDFNDAAKLQAGYDIANHDDDKLRDAYSHMQKMVDGHIQAAANNPVVLAGFHNEGGNYLKLPEDTHKQLLNTSAFTSTLRRHMRNNRSTNNADHLRMLDFLKHWSEASAERKNLMTAGYKPLSIDKIIEQIKTAAPIPIEYFFDPDPAEFDIPKLS